MGEEGRVYAWVSMKNLRASNRALVVTGKDMIVLAEFEQRKEL